MAQVKPDQIQFNELMLKVENRSIRIPDFQREFVWDRNQILSLLDSIYRHYPIGSFLFWETGDEIQAYRHVGEVELYSGESNSAVQYVLDGQQRITSLFASLKKATIAHKANGKKVVNSLKIYFDLDDRVFVSDPFAEKEIDKFAPYQTSPPIRGVSGYLEFIFSLLSEIDRHTWSEDELRRWIEEHSDCPRNRAVRILRILWCMGLYFYDNAVAKVSRRGIDFLADRDRKHLVVGLLEAIDGYEAIYRLLSQRREAVLNEILAELNLNREVGMQLSRARARLKWLAEVGVGKLDDDLFSIDGAEQNLLADIIHAQESLSKARAEEQKENSRRYFSLQQITDTDSLFEAVAELSKPRREALAEVKNRLESYPFPIIIIRDQPIEIACEIFERVNNSGQVLSVVDLMVAKSWSKTFNLRERIDVFRHELKKQNFNELPDILLLQCAAGMLQREVSRKAILSIPSGTLEENWEVILEAIRQAIDFLNANLRLAHGKLLPYNALVVPLSCYFSKARSGSMSHAVVEQLVRWFWRASVSNRYDAAADSKMADDIHQMLQLAGGESPAFDYIAPQLTAERVIKQQLNTNAAFCKTILCALNYQSPLELQDSSPVSMTGLSKFNAAELHHFFPQAWLRREDPENYPDKDSMANIGFARASANKHYSDKKPSEYLYAAKNPKLDTALASHLVDNGAVSGLWQNDFKTFIKYRAERIVAKLRELTGEMNELEVALLNDEAVAVETFERRFRELIRRRLPTEASLVARISAEFNETLETRVKAWLAENPTRQRAYADLVSFLQVLDYYKIVKANHDVFRDVIHSTSELEAHLKTISNFRNAVAHNREIDMVSRQLALGALMWCDNVFVAAGV